MATSKIEYHRECIEQVLAQLGMAREWTAPKEKGETEASREARGHQLLRQRLDALASTALMTAGLADFWLDLDHYEGPRRRKTQPPESPFNKQGRKQVGEKARIAAWHDAWERKKLAHAIEGMAQLARSPEGKAAYEILLRQAMGWVTSQDTIVGNLAWLPALPDALPGLDIEWLRLDQALERRWTDRKEAGRWLALFAGCQRMQLAHLEQVQLDMATPEAPSRPRRGGTL